MSSSIGKRLRLHVSALLLLYAGTLACRSAPVAASSPLSESDVVALVLLANSAEVSWAQVAASRTARPDVRALAHRMATDHAALNATLADVLARLDITPGATAATVSLRDRSNARLDLLRSAAAPAFDSMYAQTEIESHRELLQLFDQQLLPSARRAELREYLAAFRPAVRAHLAHAEQVMATLAAR